ncbi:hypothetical protein D3C73_1270690 [compost metagenome]
MFKDKLHFYRRIHGISIRTVEKPPDIILEANTGVCRILHLDDFIQHVGGHTSGDRSNLAPEPLQQIKGMDRLVNQHSAAFGSPFAPPAALRVIVFAPVPCHNPLHADELAQNTGIDGLFDPYGRGIIAVLKDHAKLTLAG